MSKHRNIVKTLVALSATSLALASAGTAGAQPNGSGAPAKKGCSVQLQGPGAGQSIVYDHGYSFSVTNKSTGKTHTYTCNDGKWTETVSRMAPRGGYAISSTQGKFEVLRSGAGRYTGREAPAGGRYAATRA